MGISVIVTGATGMVGEGVLHECILSDNVSRILVLGRSASGLKHPKVTELVHRNLYDLSAVEQLLDGYDACFFCLGTTSIGKDADEYYAVTYTLTMHVAETLSRRNAAMTFCYVSGKGTDSTEKGSSRWARVKGKTENDLMKLPFASVYNFRPGFIAATPGLKRTQPLYKFIGWAYPIVRAMFPKAACSLRELGLAMIRVSTKGYPRHILEVPDIIDAAR